MLQSYPPSHRNIDDPQIEVCDVCGLWVGARHLADATAEGLRGFRVCDVTPSCRDFRHKLSYGDRRRMSTRTSFVGQSRMYQPGALPWWTDSPTDNPFTPAQLAHLAMWMRQDAIPYTAKCGQWGTITDINLPFAIQTTAANKPDVLTATDDPFGSDYRAVEFGTLESLALDTDVEASGAFTYCAAFRTPASLADTFLVRKAAVTSGIKLLSTGAVEVDLNGGTAVSVAAAASLAISTNYVLSVLRTSGGVFACRVNGTDVTSAATQAGTLTLATVGQGTAGGMVVAMAEELFYTTDHSADIGDIERYLGYLVGVSL